MCLAQALEHSTDRREVPGSSPDVANFWARSFDRQPIFEAKTPGHLVKLTHAASLAEAAARCAGPGCLGVFASAAGRCDFSREVA